MSYSIGLLATTLSSFLQIYFVLMIIRVLLSWFPNINWYDPPFSILSQLTDPYLNLFRSIIPPLGGIDFSPLIAFFVLQFGSEFLIGLLSNLQTAL
ncbi:MULTISPECIES: YggT family protein [Microcoleus]|uniref:YggT family protein n=1 Tax=Microcoleus anatoxicus PTRS2 TaxID=2705321 RepID=A0ABU8YLP9_9CYAN|nr:MAG: YggT family protein [Oscillatoriales cyanobacterium]TAD95575.1 MAG: YggT family protein [Oscillatoriales cyanobacterium]TAE03254.1 MAG: YggT family protein [Oscillatoriales cyanobacterium]TAE98973.1 MAG: YggT family protein [Oscillatoriales cyanobacterium]TAF44108.1 MAG: YggT family protein [Oscillatoriales cyanobacterium]